MRVFMWSLALLQLLPDYGGLNTISSRFWDWLVPFGNNFPSFGSSLNNEAWGPSILAWKSVGSSTVLPKTKNLLAIVLRAVWIYRRPSGCGGFASRWILNFLAQPIVMIRSTVNLKAFFGRNVRMKLAVWLLFYQSASVISRQFCISFWWVGA